MRVQEWRRRVSIPPRDHLEPPSVAPNADTMEVPDVNDAERGVARMFLARVLGGAQPDKIGPEGQMGGMT